MIFLWLKKGFKVKLSFVMHSFNTVGRVFMKVRKIKNECIKKLNLTVLIMILLA